MSQRFSGRRRVRTQLLDAGGKRHRQQQMVAADKRFERVNFNIVEPLPKPIPPEHPKALTIPFLTSVKSLKQVTQDGRQEFPAIQIDSDIPTKEVFKYAFGSKQPNRASTRTNEQNAGAHFDHYYENFSTWTLHTDLVGNGILRACFLSAELFDQYKELVNAVSVRDEAVMSRLALHRATIGQLYIDNPDTVVYEGRVQPKTRTLLWHGTSEAGSTPPAVHDFVREGVGSYAVYACQTNSFDIMPEGFIKI